MAGFGSFLTVFRDILHASEVAAQLAAPIVASMDPVIGGLMTAAAQAAVGVEASITTPGSGATKAAAVAQATQAAIDATNAILQAEGKKQLPANTDQIISQQVGVVVGNLNAIKQAVTNAQPSGAAPPPAAS